MDKVATLGSFLNYVRDIRSNLWRVEEDKELWFRGENQDHKDTLLRPELYRPGQSGSDLRSIDDLLNIESQLYGEFQRCADQFRSEALDREYWTGIPTSFCSITAELRVFSTGQTAL